MGHNPAHIRDCGENCPVESVSWKEAQEFIEKLNKMEGTHKYRLPTEAEWEYACRAGTTTPFSTGKCISTDQANYNATNPMPGCPKGEARGKIVSVGSFPPNPWGLYDMHGNVWEWCQDWYGDYPQGEVTDPRGPASGRYRVFRGGSYDFDAWLIRSAVRGNGDPESHSGSVGFRLVRDF
jgi:sulfatase modifying factor 1